MARLSGQSGPKQLRWADPKVGNQQAAFQYGPAPTCLSGGWGAGKTVVAFIKLLFIMDLFPGYRVAVVRKVWDELKKTTMGTLFKLLPPAAYQYSGRRNDQDKVCTLNNGSSFVFLHLDDPEKAGVLGGLEINGFFINQAEQVEEEVFDKLSGRIGRWDYAQVPRHVLDAYQRGGRQWPWRNEQGDAVPPSYQLIDCNPDHEFHWIYRRFHPDSKEHYERKIETDDKTQKGHWGLVSFHDLGYRMFTMDSRDNQFTPKEYKNQLMRRDRSFVDRYVKGLWGNPEGRLHTVPDESIIPGDPAFVQKLLSTCILYRTLDHGDSSPTACGWWAVDAEKNIYCFREYYIGGKRIGEHRANISALSLNEQYAATWADPSIFYEVQARGFGKGQLHTIYDEYRDCVSLPRTSALFMQPADNNEMGTRNKINELLVVNPDRIHPYTRMPGAPRIFFIERSDAYPNGCNMAIRELKAQRREKLGTDLGKPVFSDDRDKSVPDHGYDFIRYMVSSPAVAPTMVLAKHGYSFHDARESVKVLNKAKGRGWSRLFALARVGR